MSTSSDSDETGSIFSLVGELEEGELSSGLEEEEEEEEIKDKNKTPSYSSIRITFDDPIRPIPIVVACSDTGYTITNGTKYLSYEGIDELWLDHLSYNISSFVATRRPFSPTIYATDAKSRMRIQKCWKRGPYDLLIHTVEDKLLPRSCCQELDCHRLKADRILKRISHEYEIPVCHGAENRVWLEKGILFCKECQQSFNIYDYLTQTPFQSPFQSSRLALEYAQSTGDISVPCSFPLVDVPGIVPKLIITPLSTLRNATRLLRLLNSPFCDRTQKEVSHLDELILKNFLNEYIRMVESMPFPNTIEAKTVKALLTNMKEMFDKHIDFFKYYMTIIIPYIRYACPEQPSYDGPEYDEKTIEPSRAFYYEIQKSNWVRQQYGSYSIPLDALHVMAYCYACSCDLDVIGNFTFHLVAKVCSENSFKASPSVSKRVKKILMTQIAYNKNTDLYYLIKRIEQGEAADCLSMEFLERYGQLENLLLDELLRQHQQEEVAEEKQSSDVLKYTFSQVFPYILFSSHEYYGFMAALGYLAKKIKSSGRRGVLEKGSFANARRLYKSVNTLMGRVRDFEKSSDETTVYWTTDTFKLLVCSDELLEKELYEMIPFLLNEREEQQLEETPMPTNTQDETME